MAKIAIIGTGRIGSAVASILLEHDIPESLLLINRTISTAEGLKYDLLGTFPRWGNRIKIGAYTDSQDADIVLVTVGAFGAPTGVSLWDTNSPIIEEIFASLSFAPKTKIITITTPCDRIAAQIMRVVKAAPEQVYGFGGQLDENRLRYLIMKQRDNFEDVPLVQYIGEHGSRGIPLFKTQVPDRHQVIDDTRNFFKKFLSQYGASTIGTARELSILVEAMLSSTPVELNISHYHTENKLFLTWPCNVSKAGVVPLQIALSSSEKTELEKLIKSRQLEEQNTTDNL